MVIKDKIINKLVDEQTGYFLNDAPLKDKMDVKKRIEKRQKELKKMDKDEADV